MPDACTIPRMTGDTRSNCRGTGIVFILLAAMIVCATSLRLNRPSTRGDVLNHNPPWPDMRIDVNHADASELTLLPGIGPALAHRIVEDRNERGEFESLDDLVRVRWIGPVIVERIEPYVMLGSAHDFGSPH